MTVEGGFSAAHALRDYPGPCCRVHGHNYRVVVHLAGEELDALGMLIDFTEVKAALARITDRFDHAMLNELAEFTTVNPTSEAIARHIYQHLRDDLFTREEIRRRVRLTEVEVYETDRQGVGYGES